MGLEVEGGVGGEVGLVHLDLGYVGTDADAVCEEDEEVGSNGEVGEVGWEGWGGGHGGAVVCDANGFHGGDDGREDGGAVGGEGVGHAFGRDGAGGDGGGGRGIFGVSVEGGEVGGSRAFVAHLGVEVVGYGGAVEHGGVLAAVGAVVDDGVELAEGHDDQVCPRDAEV